MEFLRGECQYILVRCTLSYSKTRRKKYYSRWIFIPYKSSVSPKLILTDLFHFNVGIFMVQLSNNELPDVFLHMFKRNRAIHDYPTRQRDVYHLPRTRTLFAKRTIMFIGPRYWNDLPEEISHCLSLFSFKRKFKEFLLNEYNLQTH